MLNEKWWAHSYLMCKPDFDTTNAIDKMLDILEKAGITIAMPMALQTMVEIDTAGRIREIATTNARGDQMQTLEKAKDIAFIMWVTNDESINNELELIH